MVKPDLFRAAEGHVEYATCLLWPGLRPAVEAAFEQYAPFADEDFVAAFPRETTQRLWELLVFHALLRDGKTPTAPKKHSIDEVVVKGGPDFLLDGTPRVWVECVASGPGDGENCVPPMTRGFGTYAAVDKKMDLRLVTSMDEKRKKFDKYLKQGIVKHVDANVIALNPRDVHPLVNATDNLGIPVYVRVLYGLGAYYEVVVPVGDGSVRFPRAEWEHRPLVEKKRSDGGVAEVGTALFLDERYAHVSALIGGMPGAQAFLDEDALGGRGLVVVHNPLAKTPLPHGFFAFGREYWIEGWDGERGSFAVHDATLDAVR